MSNQNIDKIGISSKKNLFFQKNINGALDKEIEELLKLQNSIIDKLNDILRKLDKKLSA